MSRPQVNLDIGKSVVNAFAVGRAEALDRLKNQQAQQQLALDNQYRQQQAAEQKAEFEKRLKQEEAQFKAQHDLQQAIFNLTKVGASREAATYFEQTGNLPTGFQLDPTKTSMVETAPGVFEPRITATNPNLGITFQARSPELATTQDISKQAQGIEAVDKAHEANLIFQENLKRETAKLGTENQLDAQKQMNAIEFANQKTMSEIEYRHNLGLLQERLRVSTALGKSGGFELWQQNQIDPDAKKQLKEQLGINVPDNATWGDVFGNIQLDNKGKDKFYTYSQMEPDLIKLINIMNQPDPEDPFGKKDNFDRFFIGGLRGAGADLAIKITGQTDPWVESVRPIMGKIFLLMKEDANLGAALTANEKELLQRYVAGGERSMPSDVGRSILGKALPSLRKARVDAILTYGKAKTPSAIGGNFVNFDFTGNLIDDTQGVQ